jgi:hypothetical protein
MHLDGFDPPGVDFISVPAEECGGYVPPSETSPSFPSSVPSPTPSPPPTPPVPIPRRRIAPTTLHRRSIKTATVTANHKRVSSEVSLASKHRVALASVTNVASAFRYRRKPRRVPASYDSSTDEDEAHQTSSESEKSDSLEGSDYEDSPASLRTGTKARRGTAFRSNSSRVVASPVMDASSPEAAPTGLSVGDLHGDTPPRSSDRLCGSARLAVLQPLLHPDVLSILRLSDDRVPPVPTIQEAATLFASYNRERFEKIGSGRSLFEKRGKVMDQWLWIGHLEFSGARNVANLKSTRLLDLLKIPGEFHEGIRDHWKGQNRQSYMTWTPSVRKCFGDNCTTQVPEVVAHQPRHILRHVVESGILIYASCMLCGLMISRPDNGGRIMGSDAQRVVSFARVHIAPETRHFSGSGARRTS